MMMSGFNPLTAALFPREVRNMRSLWSCGLVTAAMVVGLTEMASAQTRPGSSGSLTGGSTGGFTGGSMFSSGSSGLGGGLGGSSGGLGGGLGGGQGGLGGGQGGLGGGLGGQSGLGGGQQGGLGGSNPFGQQNSGFIGRNGSNNQFIGANAQGQNGQNSQFGNQSRQGGRGQRNQANQNQFNQNSGGQDANRNAGVRPRQKVAFEHPTVQTTAAVTKIETQFKKLSTKMSGLGAVQLTAEADGTVVLTGAAASRADARLAESMVRLEPGVRSVRNEMTYPPVVDEVQ